MKLNLLVVTDHRTHTDTNSVYDLCRALHEDPRCGQVWVASKGVSQNEDFFDGQPDATILGLIVTDMFEYSTTGACFNQSAVSIDRSNIDVIVIRMPQPVDPVFLRSLTSIAPNDQIINSPGGIIETGSKAFLLEVADLCPEPILCHSLQQALELRKRYEIVLKPLYSYGGRGMVRMSLDTCWSENDCFPIEELSSFLNDSHFPMLAMRFLKNVIQGDKRTIVANKKILGSALRMPPPGSWMCNVAQGGQALLSEADDDELRIEEILTPILYKRGIVIYGFDTLVDDDGRRVLSEINTLSIGGLVPLQEMSGRPVVKEVAALLWDYIESLKAKG